LERHPLEMTSLGHLPYKIRRATRANQVVTVPISSVRVGHQARPHTRCATSAALRACITVVASAVCDSSLGGMCQIWRPCAAAKLPAEGAGAARWELKPAVSARRRRGAPIGLQPFRSSPRGRLHGRLPPPPGTGQRRTSSGGHCRLGEATAVERTGWRAAGRRAGRVTGRGGLAFRLREEPRPRSRFPAGSPLRGSFLAVLHAASKRCGEARWAHRRFPGTHGSRARGAGLAGWPA
jgi:hypothetical protein